jgi:hypothetical protein
MNDKVNASLHFAPLMYDILYISMTKPVKNQGQIRELSV